MKHGKRAGDFRPMIPQGVQCYFGEEVHRRRKVESVLAGIMKSWGFQEIILPFFDYLDSFSYGLGSDMGDKAYRFLDKDGSLLALRPDLTPLVAKTVATRMTDRRPPIKLFYSGEVFRQERTGRGKQKEFYQIGLESMGVAQTWADIEVILLAIDCLLRLGVEDFKIVLGHVGFFNGIVEGLNLSAEKASALRDAIDRKDSAWLRKEVAELNLAENTKEFLATVPDYAGGRKMLEQVLAETENPRSRKAVLQLLEINSVAAALGLDEYLTFDLAEVRGLDYYTGILFKIYGRSHGMELGGGGRYDGLLSKFGWDLPAVGFSFTLDQLLSQVNDVGRVIVPEAEVEEFVIATEGVAAEEMFRQLWEFRQQGLHVHLGRRP
jgi:ATP phosphoribosyltransferase regulatory subunit